MSEVNVTTKEILENYKTIAVIGFSANTEKTAHRVPIYMIEQGYAHEYTYDLPYKYQTEFKAAKKAAQENQLGLWSPATCNGDTASSSVTTTQTTSTTVSTNIYYTSSYYTSKYYYPESCDGWRSLSTKYLKSFNSLEDLLAAYPSRTLSPQCQ